MEIPPVIFRRIKTCGAVVSALDNVPWYAWNGEARATGHANSLLKWADLHNSIRLISRISKIIVVCPLFFPIFPREEVANEKHQADG
jgi:hypothetical protein